MPKVTSLSFEYGMSTEINKIWHKFGSRLELELLPEEQTPEIIAEIKSKGWNTVISEVEKQVREIIG